MKNPSHPFALWWRVCICLALMCVVSMQAFAQTQADELTSGKVYRIKTANQASNAQAKGYVSDNNGTLLLQSLNTDDAANAAQLWTVTAVEGQEGYYQIQNNSTKRYLQPTNDNSTAVTTSETATSVYVPKNAKTGQTDVTWFNIMANASSTYSYNWRDDLTVRGWKPNDGNGSGLTGSEWAFIPYITFDEVLATRDDVPAVAGDKVYRILNKSTRFSNSVLNETNNSLGSVDKSSEVLSQYWQLVDQGNGTIALRNLYTGHYVQSLAGKKGRQYQMGTTAYGFTIAANGHVYAYDVRDDATLGLNCTDQANGAIYSWTFYDGTNDENSLWVFLEASLTDDQKTAIEANRAAAAKEDALQAHLQQAKLRIRSRRSDSGYANRYVTDITDATPWDGSSNTCRMQELISGDEANRQVWIAYKQSDGGYKFRNLYTGKYLNYNDTDDGDRTWYIQLNPDNATAEQYVNISEKADFSENGLHYQKDYHLLMAWSISAPDYEGCDWTFEDADVEDDAVRTQFDKFDGYLQSVVTDQWLTLRNMNGSVISENTASHVGDVNSPADDYYAQYWRLVAVEGSEGYYQIQNAVTKRYINFANFNSRVSTSETAPEGGFKINFLTSSFRFNTCVEFVPATSTDGSSVLHRSEDRLLIWNSYGAVGAEGSVWNMQKANVTDEAVLAAQQAYEASVTEQANAEAYRTALPTFFSDAACTALNASYQSMTDDELRTAMTEAGISSTALQSMAIKVKNDSWAKREKTFRVRSIEPYTDPDNWNNMLRIGYVYTRLSNPTGIWSDVNGVFYIFVGSDIPDGCTVQAHLVGKSDSQGSATTLQKGLNIVPVSTASALYVSYTVPTTTADDSKRWRDFANLDVHIEGGTIDGYFDATRTGSGIDTDADWKEMVADGLFQRPFVMMKGRNVIYQMNGTLTKKYVPEKMREIVDFWDWMVDVQHSLMAVDEYKDRWHSVLGFYSCTYNFMFASSYGTYYNESTLGEILNYDTMASGGGSLWGPAHEVGHIHQGLINMIGCTEISNNLFAQAVVHLNGKTSTRLNGRKFWNVSENYAAHKSWHDYDLWDRNSMYLKLYLYYEVEGHKPGFFCELFRQLRKDPLNHSKGSQSSPIPASEDFLKFAVKVCQVAGDDLSEFFRAYGFFVTFDTRMIGDYGDYYTNCTQEMVDAALTEMHKFPKPKSNLLFIENHIKHEPAIDHDGNYLYDSAGKQILRTDYDENDAVGKCGDVGSYSDYSAGHYASGYTYNNSNGTLTFTGTGAVGYKVYDNDGNLLYFDNRNSFTLPESVQTALSAEGKTMVVKVAQADGTDVALPAPDATTYTLKVYRADALTDDKSATVYTDGSSATLPVLEDNALAYVVDESDEQTQASLPTALAEATNVVRLSTATASNVVITDKKDFYAPSAFTASTLSYERTNTSGYNSVCLPFPISAADFGDEAKVEQFSSTNASASGTTLRFETTTEELPAGTPCIVWCPESTTSWSIQKTDALVTPSPVEATTGDATLKGSFLAQTIGAGKYKLNASGTAFGITTAAGRITPFRCYLEPASSASAPRLFIIEHGESTTTGIHSAANSAANTASAPATDAVYYDLSGRRTAHPQQHGIYILGGKKVVK